MTEQPVRVRFEALDVLRGLAILGMALSGMVPYRTLPAWMYHAQLPPPTRDFDPSIFGLTWVDVVFPMFLFAMGAAIPLSLSRRLESGDSSLQVLKGLLGRGLLIAAYALVGQHLRPFVLADDPGLYEWIVSLVGFVLVGVILLRWPPEVPARWRRIFTASAWAGAAFIIAFWNYPDGTRGFANYRNDVILMVLANVAVSGGAIWMWTRDRPAIRWVVVAALAAVFLAKDSPGVSKTVWDWDPTNYLPFKNGPYGRFLPILYHFEYHKYLLLVLPATFVGDILRLASVRREQEWHVDTRMWVVLVGVGPAALLVACAGLSARWVASTTVLLALLLLCAGVVSRLLAATAAAAEERGPAEGRLRIHAVSRIRWPWSGTARPMSNARGWPIGGATAIPRLVALAAPLLIVGLLAEPIGGGVRKDPATISYFFVTGGLCCLLLASLAAGAGVVEKSRVWKSIRDTGVNPIVGYLTLTNLVWGIVGITGLEAWVNGLTQNPWLLLGWAFVKTVFVALVTAWFTRKRIFLRA